VQEKSQSNRTCPAIRDAVFPSSPGVVISSGTLDMTDIPQSPSAHIVDVAASVAAALAALERCTPLQSAVLAISDETERIAAEAIDRVESNLVAWQGILSAIADTVRSAHDDLAAVDLDLRQSLDAFAAARKYLQTA
jgi:NADH:ubiquinone oxidoreductase subunit H